MTRGRLLAGVASIALFAGPAKAADVLTVALSAPAPSSWAGGYVGVTAGGAWGAFGTATSTPVNPSNFFSDAAVVGAINAAGANSAKTNGFATGIEAGYNWQNGPFLLGVEADLQSLHLNGAASSGAIRYPSGGGQFVVTSYSAANWLFTSAGARRARRRQRRAVLSHRWSRRHAYEHGFRVLARQRRGGIGKA